MSPKTIDTDMAKPDEQFVVRLEYNSPMLEEYGELHELTHGLSGDGTDAGGAPSFPEGIMQP